MELKLDYVGYACASAEQAVPAYWPRGQVSQHSSRLRSHILFISQNREAWTLVPPGSHRWPLLSPTCSLGGEQLALATIWLWDVTRMGNARARGHGLTCIK